MGGERDERRCVVGVNNTGDVGGSAGGAGNLGRRVNGGSFGSIISCVREEDCGVIYNADSTTDGEVLFRGSNRPVNRRHVLLGSPRPRGPEDRLDPPGTPRRERAAGLHRQPGQVLLLRRLPPPALRLSARLGHVGVSSSVDLRRRPGPGRVPLWEGEGGVRIVGAEESSHRAGATACPRTDGPIASMRPGCRQAVFGLDRGRWNGRHGLPVCGPVGRDRESRSAGKPRRPLR